MDTKTIKEQVIEGVRFITSHDLVAGTAGNVSIIDRDTNIVYITPTSFPYDQMTPDDVVGITLDGEVVDGRHVPSSEWLLHTQIYKAYDHVGAIAHTHSAYATSFAVSSEPIPFILIEMTKSMGGDVPVAKFGMPATDEVGKEAVKVLKDRNACLLESHGAVAVGADLPQACQRASILEEIAKVYHYAKLNGHVRLIPEEDKQFMLDRAKGKIHAR